jgi:hypothetical protein
MLNFGKEANSSGNTVTFIFFNGLDISFGLLLWLVSAGLILLIYLRFMSGRWLFSTSFFLGRMKRKSSLVLNPLLGKV